MQYTPAQQTAISFPDENLLLSAAAGSGKTATLTARILSLLENEKARLSEMLIVTYTRAAAAELRGRIGQKITEAARSSGSRRMARHLTDLPGADISTIHAFLYRTLRPSFAALGLSPDFTIGDEAVIDTLRQDAMRDTLDDFFADRRDEDFIRLADTLSGPRDASSLDKTLLDIYQKITAVGETPDALERYAGMLETGGGFFAMPQSGPIRDRLRRAFSHYRQVISALRMDFSEPVEDKYGPAAQGILDFLDRADAALDTGSYGAVRDTLASYEPVPLGRLMSKNATPESDAFKAVRDDCKKDMARFLGQYFGDPEELAEASLHRTASLLRTCGRVLSAYAQAFRQRKHARSLLDYGDLEALALELFLDENGDPTEAAKETGARYKYIFVDEYQDTNRVQDAIFRALGQASPRFMVGDSKQSIYRFRGAEPSVFAGYRDAWDTVTPGAGSASAATGLSACDMDKSEQDTAFSPAGGHCLFMSENFRCDRPVVDFVNLVSDYLFPHSSMPYTGEDALVFGKTPEAGRPDTAAEIVLVEKPTAPEDEEDAPAPAAEEDPEAEYVAGRILAMLGDADAGLSPDDIAILLRSPDSSAAPFREALARRGIPVRLQNTAPLFTSPAILLALCLAHVADNPLHDIPTAGAMHSPLFGFATHELVTLRDWSRAVLRSRYHWEGDLPLYYIVRMAVEETWDLLPELEETDSADTDMPPENDPAGAWLAEAWLTEADWTDPVEQTGIPDIPAPAKAEPVKAEPDQTETLPESLLAKCRTFYTEAEQLRVLAHGMKADRFLDTVYRRYSFFDLPEIAENPVEKTNLLTLYDLARRYESGMFAGVGGFLTYAEELRDRERERGIEDALPAVIILSIHKSKGLEFPVVFVSACSKKRNSRDEEGDILFDADLGFGMRLPDEGGYARCGTALRSAIGEKKRLESVEEEMRVVYVALTRARNRLIVTGKVRDAEATAEKCRMRADFATDYSVTGSATYLEWILTAALRHGPDPCWRLLTVTPVQDDTVSAPAEAENDTAETLTAADWEARLAGNMDFTYPWDYLAKVPAKLTVSGLHGAVLDEEDGAPVLSIDLSDPADKPGSVAIPGSIAIPGSAAIPNDSDGPETDPVENCAPFGETSAGKTAGIPTPMPKFMQDTPVQTSAADRGTATHMFLQFADFALLRENGVQAELDRLTDRHFLDEKTAASVYVTQLERFRTGDLLARMCASPMCRREFRFNVPMDAWRFTENADLAEKLRRDSIRLIVQGVVDCVFRDTDGTLTLVDYKTDRPLAEEYKNPALADARFIARHGKQLGYYREICEAMFGEPIGKTVIYSTALAREIVTE